MRTRLMRSKFTLLFLTIAMLLAIPAVAAFAQDTGTPAAPTIQSDKEDYPPGGFVTLTGSGWQPGEAVHINVNDDEGKTWSRDVDVTADASGNISDSFNLPDWFVATYKVTATGAQSGVATTMFTDGNVNVKANLTGTETWTLVDGARYNSSTTCSPVSNRQLSSVQSNVTLTGSNQLATAFGANQGQTVRLTASASSSGGKTFVEWTDPSGNAVAAWDDPSTTSVVETDKKVICVSGFSGSGVNVYTANYVAAPTAAPTTLSVDPASGTYGGTANLTAKLTKTSDSTNVNGKTITFSLRGTAVCDNDGTTPKPDCPTTDTNGVATLNNVSLSGIDAGGPTGPGYTGAVTASFAGDTSFGASNGSNNLTVNKKSVTGSFTAANKVYDGTNAATITGRSLSGQISGDDVSLSGGTATFGDKNVGTGKTVTGTGFSLAGAKANNYTLASSTLTTTANITARPITVTAASDTKVYDGTTSSNGTPTVTTGSLATGDTANFTQVFANKDVGTGKTLTPSGSVNDGNNGGNYNVTFANNNNGTITQAPLDITAVSDTKVYDGTTASSGVPTVSGLQGTDTVTNKVQQFQSKNVLGSGNSTLEVTSYTVNDGNSGGNYQVTTHTASGTITARSLTVSATGQNKTYDGTTSATVFLSTNALVGDDVTASYASASFADKNVGEGKPISVSGITLSGADKDNYTPNTTTSTSADINARPITVTAASDTKVYDGTTSSNGTPTVTTGSLATGDTGSFTQAFANKNVGTGKTLTPSGSVNDGNGGNNYSITFVDNTNGVINKAPLDISAVTDTKVYDGTTASSGVPTVSGLQGTDTVTNKVQQFQSKNVLGSGNSTLEVTSYTVSDGNSGGNYQVTTHTASGTITKAPLDISAVSDTKVYDGTKSSSKTPTVSGLQGSDSVTGKAQEFQSKDVLGANGSTLEVTTYTVSDGNSGGNYQVTTHTASGTITKAPLTVKADDKSKKLGDPNPTFTVTYSGFVPGETQGVLGGALNFTTNVPNPEQVGTWDITPGGLTSSNYEITFAKGTLTITYKFDGFRSPVDNPGTATPPVFNSAKAGQSIPVKFSLFGNQGLNILQASTTAVPNPKVTSVNCTTSAVVDPLEEYASVTANGGLTYDATADQYNYVWKTQSNYATKCFKFDLVLKDGTSHVAYFKFLK